MRGPFCFCARLQTRRNPADVLTGLCASQGCPLKDARYAVHTNRAASKVYSGKNYTDAVPLGYYLSKGEGKLMHPETRALLEKLLYLLRDKGERYTLGYMRWLKRHPALYERQRASRSRAVSSSGEN